jgi:hypothetical protein
VKPSTGKIGRLLSRVAAAGGFFMPRYYPLAAASQLLLQVAPSGDSAADERAGV